MSAPLLIFGYGNPSRGDDALGPLFLERAAERLAAEVAAHRVEFLGDFQLQVEHCLDLVGRTHILFVDASVACAEPFEMRYLRPERDTSYTSHRLSPAALLHAYEQTMGHPPPESHVLCIRGYSFELGESLSAGAAHNLEAAINWLRGWASNEFRTRKSIDGCDGSACLMTAGHGNIRTNK